MRSGSNHGELGSARFMRSARTAKAYAIVRVDGYPALVPGTTEVPGELFAVNREQVARLDAFEGDAYERKNIELSDGAVAEAYVLVSSRRTY